MSRLTLSIVAAAAISFAAANAAPASVTVTGTMTSDAGNPVTKATTVAYDDSTVGTEQGATALYERIATAARMVCGERDGVKIRSDRQRAFEVCRTKATNYAVAAVNAPELAKVAAAHK